MFYFCHNSKTNKAPALKFYSVYPPLKVYVHQISAHSSKKFFFAGPFGNYSYIFLPCLISIKGFLLVQCLILVLEDFIMVVVL